MNDNDKFIMTPNFSEPHKVTINPETGKPERNNKYVVYTAKVRGKNTTWLSRWLPMTSFSYKKTGSLSRQRAIKNEFYKLVNSDACYEFILYDMDNDIVLMRSYNGGVVDFTGEGSLNYDCSSHQGGAYEVPESYKTAKSTEEAHALRKLREEKKELYKNN